MPLYTSDLNHLRAWTNFCGIEEAGVHRSRMVPRERRHYIACDVKRGIRAPYFSWLCLFPGSDSEADIVRWRIVLD